MNSVKSEKNRAPFHSYENDMDHSPVYLQAAEKFGTNLFRQAPVSLEYLRFIKQKFTMEEAAVLRHLNSYPNGKTADMIAAAENRPVGEIQAVLEGLSNNKRAIMSYGPEQKRRYAV